MDEKKILSQNDIDALLGGDASDDPMAAEIDVNDPDDTSRDGQMVDTTSADEDLPAVVQLSSIGDIPAAKAETEQQPAATAQPEPASAPPPPPPEAAPAPPPPVPVAAASDPMLAKKVSQLTARLDKIDSALKRLEQIDKRVGEMTKRYAGLANQLERSFGISAQHGFACSSCGTHGNVAAKVRCTSCGHDALWGWWPKNETVNHDQQGQGHQQGRGHQQGVRRVRSILTGQHVVVPSRPFGN